ncbi:hypothetical protein ACOSQ3_017086 [Xanthoceras sorbifolium]
MPHNHKNIFFRVSILRRSSLTYLPCRSRRRLCHCLVQTNCRRLCRVTPPLVLAVLVPSSPLSQLGLYVAAGPLIIYQLKVSYLISRGEDRLLKFEVSET